MTLFTCDEHNDCIVVFNLDCPDCPICAEIEDLKGIIASRDNDIEILEDKLAAKE